MKKTPRLTTPIFKTLKKKAREKTQISGKREKKLPNQKRQFLKVPKKRRKKTQKKNASLITIVSGYPSTACRGNCVSMFISTILVFGYFLFVPRTTIEKKRKK